MKPSIFPKPDNCSESLKERGRLYTRTCAVCGLGPCLYLPSPYPPAEPDTEQLDAAFTQVMGELEAELSVFQKELDDLSRSIRMTRWAVNILTVVLAVYLVTMVWKWF